MSKFKDAFLGFIVGDAMGVPTEFLMREKLLQNPVLDMIGYGSHNVPKGSWSDDTSMTLALMDSIIDNKCIDYSDIMNKFLMWDETGKYSSINRAFGIGRTTLNALKCYKYKDEFKEYINPINCGQKNSEDNGNGSLMRILPIAFYSYYNKLNNKEIIELVNNISSLTHGHEISLLGCYIYVNYIMFLLDGMDKLEAYESIKMIDYSLYSKDSIEKYNRILMGDISKLKLNDISSSGYIVDTLEASMWCFIKSKTYKEAIIGTTNLGNDTDTIGALCGSMAGIYYEYDNIPANWIEKLAKKDFLMNIIEKFEETITNE